MHNERFHNKWHGYNHHSISTEGFLDSGQDPIASAAHPFRGDFYLDGKLISTNEDIVFGASKLPDGSFVGGFSVLDIKDEVESLAQTVGSISTTPNPAIIAAIQSHVQNINNPHNVTKEQLGIVSSLGTASIMGDIVQLDGRVDVLETAINITKPWTMVTHVVDNQILPTGLPFIVGVKIGDLVVNNNVGGVSGEYEIWTLTAEPSTDIGNWIKLRDASTSLALDLDALDNRVYAAETEIASMLLRLDEVETYSVKNGLSSDTPVFHKDVMLTGHRIDDHAFLDIDGFLAYINEGIGSFPNWHSSTVSLSSILTHLYGDGSDGWLHTKVDGKFYINNVEVVSSPGNWSVGGSPAVLILERATKFAGMDLRLGGCSVLSFGLSGPAAKQKQYIKHKVAGPIFLDASTIDQLDGVFVSPKLTIT